MKIRQQNLTALDWRIIFKALKMLRDYTPATLEILVHARVAVRGCRHA